MEPLNIFEGEKIISESNDRQVTLTSHRIRYNSSSSSHAHIVSIMLEKLSSIEVNYKSYPLLLVLAIVGIGFGLFLITENETESMIASIGAGLFFLLGYFMTRKHIVSIASDGGSKIQFQTKGMKRKAILDFINQVELVKHALH